MDKKITKSILPSLDDDVDATITWGRLLDADDERTYRGKEKTIDDR